MQLSPEVIAELFTGAATTAVAWVAYDFSRRSAKLEAILEFERRWFDFNLALAQDEKLRSAYGRLSAFGTENSSEDVRFLYVLIGQALSAFHLRKAGAVRQREYEGQLTMIAKVMGGAGQNSWSLIQQAGLPGQFLRDLERVVMKVTAEANAKS